MILPTLGFFALFIMVSSAEEYPSPHMDLMGPTGSVVLITGGEVQNTSELFLPSYGISCTLPALPGVRAGHTLDNHMLCGGIDTDSSCLLWSPDSGTWEDWGEELYYDRRVSVSWTPSVDTSGIYLIGGTNRYSQRTTTLVKPDGTQEPGFALKYDADQACAIPDPDTETLVITGGRDSMNTVAVYSDKGWQKDLMPLNIGRCNHACASYTSGGRRMFLVSGGHRMIGAFSYTDSTEFFDPDLGFWSAGAALPSPRQFLRATSIDNRILLFGGNDWSDTVLDTILEYDISGDSYTQIGTMTEARKWHAISVVQYADFSRWCL